MELDITNFLPKYPSISKSKNDLLNPYQEDFYEAIFKKKEFYDEKLPKVENFPTEVGAMMKHQTLISRFFSSYTLYDQLLLLHEMGCLSPETPVLKWDGTTVRADEVVENDLLISDSGRPTTVVNLISGVAEMFQIDQEYGNSYTVNGNHILTLKNMSNGDIVDISVYDYVSLSKEQQQNLRGFKAPQINWRKSQTSDDPYLIGKSGFDIPMEYIVNNRQTRLSLLAGIIDTYGEITTMGVVIRAPIKPQKLIYLVRSLGFICITTTEKTLIVSGEKLEDIPVKIGYEKLFRKDYSTLRLGSSKISVTSIGKGKYVGWELDSSTTKRFLLGDFTVTHNSGKTCTAVGAIEKVRAEKMGFKGALYLAKGEGLINNFINELMFKCTDGRYIPENYDSLTELEKTHRKNKIIKEFYTLNTFETFAKEISNTSDIDLRARYNNRIIVIDEVHNLRIQSKEKGLNIYSQFHRFLHTVKNCKILLMSGTPMKDGVDEISSVMNLILPITDQLEMGDDFVEKYFSKESDGTYKIKKDKIPGLKKAFKGRVSYLLSMQSDVKKVFHGKKVGKLLHLNVVEDFMSDFQSKHYNIAYKMDREERKGVYSKSRQASLFVFPDGSSGEAGFKKYVTKRTKKAIVGDDGKKKVVYDYNLVPELKNAILGNTHDESLENLRKYSSKYAVSISNILKSQKEGKNYFVYNEYVQGSGLILFGLLLNLFGFSKATGDENENSEKPRYASLTNMTSTTSQIKKLVNRFNSPDNMNGKIIGVIMGSRKISEGFSFLNIQEEDIHTPWFNYSETSQAIARGYRLGSHRMLEAAGFFPVVNIYQRISIPKGNKPSIDLEMYEISEIKDVSIKGVERLIKISSWDCGLNYDRNHITGYDNERECDYTTCYYTCDGIPQELLDVDGVLENDELDYSTYELLYSSDTINEIIQEVMIIFRDNFRMTLESMIDYFPNYTAFEITSALRKMITNSVQIINKYGFPSYLKEENNIFFLVDSLSIVGNFYADYYTKYPTVKEKVTFSGIVKPLYFASLPKLVKNITNARTLEDVRKIMVQLPIQVHEYFIEAGILAQKNKIQENRLVRDLILEYFANYYTKFDDTWVSWLLYDDNEILRCLTNTLDSEWQDCDDPEYVEKVQEYKRVSQTKMEKNPYGFYGQFNRNTGDFCIRDVSDDIPDKKHKRTSGRRCTNWKKEDIIPIIINSLKIPIPKESEMDVKELNKWNKLIKGTKGDKNITSEKIIEEIQKNKYLKDFDVSGKSRDELLRILFWGKQQIRVLCKYVRDWFDSKGLLVEDPGCGVMGKLKI